MLFDKLVDKILRSPDQNRYLDLEKQNRAALAWQQEHPGEKLPDNMRLSMNDWCFYQVFRSKHQDYVHFLDSKSDI
jgi:hypothetical protein